MASVPTDIIALDPVDFRSVENLVKYSFTLDAGSGNIANGDETDVVLLAVAQKGQLVGVSIACNSEDYALSLRTAVSVNLPSVKEIYQVSTINTVRAEYGLEILYTNDDDTSIDALYVVVSNSDAGNETGIIELTLYISVM
jgi:hypothetical protein